MTDPGPDTTGTIRVGRSVRPLILALALTVIGGVGGVACAAPATVRSAAGSTAPGTATSPITSSSAGSDVSPSAGSAVAPAPGTTATPSDLKGATCYATAELNRTDNSIGVAFAYKEGEGYDNTVSVAMLTDACHQSLVSRGAITESDPVAACVLTDGTVGVLPGRDELCATLDLPVAAPDASAPIPR